MSSNVGTNSESILLQRNARLLELIRMNETHPNEANRAASASLLREVEANLKTLQARVQGGNKGDKKKTKDKTKDKKKDKNKKDKKTKKTKDKKKDKKRNDDDEVLVEGGVASISRSSFGLFGVPMSIMADSYKAAHFQMYPEAQYMVAYGEFRAPYKDLKGSEARFVSYGMRYLIETYLHHKWTHEDVDRGALFYKTHNAGFTPFPFPEHLFRKFINENNGYFPVKIQALKDGTVAHIHVPVYQISARGEYARLVTYLETILTHVWYTSTVATLSRKCRDIINRAFDKSVEKDNHFFTSSRLHDFGFRGVSCLEQAMLGGSAHLLSFDGTDTMPAAYYVQFGLNNGKPIGTSIPATEHSVMTSFARERDAFAHIVETYGTGVYACVMDSYDYTRALDVIVPSLKNDIVKKGGFFVMRPDSGDPVEAVIQALRAAEKTFGATTNSKGFKVINGAGVIQGDGINVVDLEHILEAIHKQGYSAQSVAFGMGSGLLHRHNRDTMSFATKLSHITYKDGTTRDVMKKPKTDMDKISLPGILKVVRNAQGIPIVVPAEDPTFAKDADLLETVWDSGPVASLRFESFDEMRQRVDREWAALPAQFDPRSDSLKKKIQKWIADFAASQDGVGPK